MVEMAPTEDGNYSKGFAGDTFNTAWYLKCQLPTIWRVWYLAAVGPAELSTVSELLMAEVQSQAYLIEKLKGQLANRVAWVEN